MWKNRSIQVMFYTLIMEMVLLICRNNTDLLFSIFCTFWSKVKIDEKKRKESEERSFSESVVRTIANFFQVDILGFFGDGWLNK